MDDKRVRRLGRCIGAALFWDLDNGHAADALRNAHLATNWLSGRGYLQEEHAFVPLFRRGYVGAVCRRFFRAILRLGLDTSSDLGQLHLFVGTRLRSAAWSL